MEEVLEGFEGFVWFYKKGSAIFLLDDGVCVPTIAVDQWQFRV